MPRSRSTGLSAAVAAWIIITGPAAAFAQLPVTELAAIYPPGGKAGATVEVAVAGNEQDDLTGMVFSHPGIQAVQKLGDATEFLPARPINNQFQVTIAGEVPPGSYAARVVGRFGISNPRAFVVGTRDEATDPGGNHQRSAATTVELERTINGLVDGSNIDHFRVTLAAGQRIMFDCAAERIDSRLDATLVLFDAQGKELARCRNYWGHDPLLDFTAPAAGEFVLGLYDALYRGGSDYFYRLTIHQGPHVDFVLPPAALPGVATNLTAFGRKLPGSQPAACEFLGQRLEQLPFAVTIPADESARRSGPLEFASPSQSVLDAVQHSLASSLAVPIQVALAPVVVEQEPNNDPAQAQALTLPCEVGGQFYPAGDDDWYQFAAKQGDVFWIDVLGHRCGGGLDPLLVVKRVTRNEQGVETVSDVASVDDPGDRAARIGSRFDSSTDDPQWRLTAEADATYRVLVRDQFNGPVPDPRRVYRLVIRSPQPDFRLAALSERIQSPDNANAVPLGDAASLRRGGTTRFEIRLDRIEGFDGDVSITAHDLPAGVSTSGLHLRGAERSGTLILAATADAPAWTGPLRIVGQARIAEREVMRQARAGVPVWNSGNTQQDPVRYRFDPAVMLAVIDKELEPVAVRLVEDKVWETSRGGKLDIPLRIERRNGFDAEFTLSARELPNEVKPGDLKIDKDKSDTVLGFAATNANARPGLYTFYLRSDAKLKYSRNPDAVARATADQKTLDDAIGQLTAAATAAPGNAEAAEKLKRAQLAKQAADMQLAEATKANSPQDRNFAVVSTAIHVRVVETPIDVQVAAPDQPLVGGQKLILACTIERKYGFEDAVELTLELPQEAKGISGNKLTINPGETSGRLEVASAADAPAGEWNAIVRAKGKFNNVDVAASTTAKIKVSSP